MALSINCGTGRVGKDSNKEHVKKVPGNKKAMLAKSMNKCHGSGQLPDRTHIHHSATTKQRCWKTNYRRSHVTWTSMPWRSREKVHTSKRHSFSSYQTNAIHIQGHGRESLAFNKVLNGTFMIPPETNAYAASLLQGLKRLPGDDTTLCTMQEHTSGWRKASKMMASSMSYVDFGHYMAFFWIRIL